MKILLIALAGAAGTLSRYGLAGLIQKVFGADFPAGTFVVNALGSFLFGLVWTLSEERLIISVEARVVVLVGFMGAFTTFSTLMFETGQLIDNSQWAMAALNLTLQCLVGMAMLFIGMATARIF